MRAVVITRSGGPEVLRIEERPDPEPGPGEVRIRVRTSAVNRADLLQRRGRYPAPSGYPPDIPGLEYAGEIEAVGVGSTRWALGSRVMGITGGGAHAELVCVHEEEAIAVPENLSWEEAGAIPEVFLTAYDALHRQAGTRRGERVLIHAVGSGVGTAALQLVAASGAIGFGSSRSPAKLARAAALGLAHPLDGSGDWVGAIDALTGGIGVDVVLDLVGGDYVGGDLRALADRGRIVVVGTMAGARTELDLGILLRKRARLIGTVLRSRPREEKAELARVFAADVLPLLESGAIRPVIQRVTPFERIAEAHRDLEANETFGKIVLRW